MAIQTDLDKLSDGITTSADTIPVETVLNPGEDLLKETITQEEENIDVVPKNDGIQLASAGPIKKVIEATDEALKRVYGNVQQKDLVVDVGDSLIIRPAEEIDLSDLNKTLFEGDKKAPGVNFYDLGKKLTTDESMRILFGFEQYDQNLSSFLENIKKANQPLFDAMKRDKISVEVLKSMAEKNGVDSMVLKMLTRKPGEVLPAEDVTASILALKNFGDIADRHVQKALETGDKTDKLIAGRYISILSQLSASLSGNVSEYARGMATVRWASKLQQGGSIQDYAEELQDIVNRAEGTEDIDYLLNFYMSIPKKQRLEFAEKSMGAKTVDALMEIYINALLSSPVTHLVNMSGNTIFQGLKLFENLPASISGAVRTNVFGQDPKDRVFLQEGFYKAHGLMMGFKDALLLSGRTFVKEEPGSASTKIELPNNKAIGNTGDVVEIMKNLKEGHILPSVIDMLGVYNRMSSRFLISEDEFFRVMAGKSAVYGEAIRRSFEVYYDILKITGDVKEAKLKSGAEYANAVKNPNTEVIENYSKELTFTGDLDGILARGQSITSHPFMKIFVPFYKTPVNIFTEVFDRTLPFNVYKKLKTGTGREKDEAIAKFVTGWGTGLAFYTFASGDYNDDFYCSGSGPDNPNAKKAWLRTGQQPYSCTVRMDDGTQRSFTFSRFDPVSPILAMASDLNYYIQHEEDQETIQLLVKTFTMAMTDYMQQHPMLQTVGEMSEILGPQSFATSSSSAYDRIVELIGEKVTSVGTSVLPMNPVIPSSSSFSAWLERQDDTTVSNTMLPSGRAEDLFGNDIGYYTELSPAVRGFYKALQKAKSRNPLWNSELPPALNLWGETRQQSSGAIWEYYSPIRIKDKKYSPVDDELVRLGNSGAGGIPMPGKKMSGILLNATEYNDYIYLMNEVDSKGRLPGDTGYKDNEMLKDALMDLIETDIYLDALTPEDQMDLIRDITSNRKRSARKHLISQHDRLGFYFEDTQ